MVRVVILIDNNKGGYPLISEHGFSVFIEDEDKRIIFDFGQSDAFFYNAIKMGINISNIDIGVLSHGHYDHSGGLKIFFENNFIAKVYTHPLAFKDRYSTSTGKKRYIGIDEEIKIKYKDRFIFTKNLEKLSKHVYFLGEIKGPKPKWKNLILKDDSPDLFEDDSAIVIDLDNRLHVITGCCHSGVFQTLAQVKEYFPDKEIISIIGGLHLNKADDDTLLLTQEALSYFNVKYVFGGHCTGERGFDFLSNIDNIKIVFLYTGYYFILD